MAPIFSFVISLQSKKKEPRCACLSEAKASQSHRTWNEVSSSVPHLKFTTSGLKKKKNPQICMSKKTLHVRGKGGPLHVPQQVLYGERCSIYRAYELLIHLYLLESPKRSPPMKCGENAVIVRVAPRWQKAYIQWGMAWFPKGILTTLLSLPHCHATFSTIPSTLAWVDHSPVSQRAS
jgi:hypothetical protein